MSTNALVPTGLIAALFIGSLQEELGWRGYALPRLIDRWGAVPASLVLGAVWACWHVPLYAVAAGGPERAPWRSS
jgi:membrane protease YdiL (CAAX protease family)